MNENTVKTRLSRAREQIRAVYANTPRQGNTGRQSMTIIQRKGEVSDEKREKTLSREFSVPESVDKAKEQAFAKIRVASGQKEPQKEAKRPKPDRHRMRFMTKVMGGAVAAAAVFTVVCVSNPALAENIPLIGHIFEELGENLGFSGDYSKYAKPLGEEKTAEAEVKEKNPETAAETAVDETTESETAVIEAKEAQTNNGYSQTVDGVTMTLSEVYCNESALNISLLIEAEDGFPDTLIDQFGKPVINLMNSDFGFSYNPEAKYTDMAYMEGTFMDDHTYAGVLRIDLNSTNVDGESMDQYYADRDSFLIERGAAADENGKLKVDNIDTIAAQAGLEDLSNEAIAAAGDPVYDDYYKLIEIPDSFTFTMNVHQIIGDKAENETPQMPQELKDAYDAAMAEHGLDEADYENFTDEEKEIEHQLFNEMYQKFYEKYPEANGLFNEYSNWFMDGDWKFSVDVTKDTSETIVREINDIDENGLGIVSVTKTPFEITFEDAMGTADGFTVVLDADGQLMEYGSDGSTNTVAIKDRDVSKIDLYICDYVEYMDEIKGYNFGWDIAESGYNTFKELLEAKALHHTEVVFE